LGKELPNVTPQRFTTGTNFEFNPVISPDGNNIVYVTWNDLEKGAIFLKEYIGNTNQAFP
jgi:Tol biopolymer transport system component